MLEYIRNLDISGMDMGLIALFFAACLVSGMLGVGIGRLVGKIKEGRSRKDAVRRSKAVISGPMPSPLNTVIVFMIYLSFLGI